MSLFGTSTVPPSVFHIVSHVASKIKKKVHFVIDTGTQAWYTYSVHIVNQKGGERHGPHPNHNPPPR